MRTKGLDKKQIRYCLSCRIGRAILSGYKDIYDMKIEDLESNIEAQEIIDEFSNDLGIEGTLIDKYALLKRLAKIKPEDETKELRQQQEDFDTEEANCLTNLQQIIRELRCFYNEKDLSDIDIITDRKKNKYMILSCMHEDNKGKKSIFGERYNETEGEKALKEFGKNDFKDASAYITKTVVKNLKYIFDFYCMAEADSYEINHEGECFGKLFNEAVEEVEKIKKEIKKETSDDLEFWERVLALSEQSQIIINAFLSKMPTKFGYNLEMVMKDKKMTEQDIAMLSSGRLRANNIQSFVQCSIPSNAEEKIEVLSKILLVSKSVLYLGHGKTYGNWKILLSDEGLKEFQVIDKECFPDKTSAKNFVRKNISSIVNEGIKDDAKFKDMLKEYPTLFTEEKYCVYENEKERFRYIIDKRYAYILLEALEELEKNE